MAESFLRSLPKVPKTDLPKGSECPICQEKYGKICPDTYAMEVALRLPCQHLIGSECIRLWLHLDGAAKNSCPYCRHEFFPSRSLLDKIAGGEQLMHAEYWDAYMVTIGVSEEQLTTARESRIARERILYRRLRAADTHTQLPIPTRGESRQGAPSMSREEALFEELERRKAFEGMFGGSGVPSNREVWDLLRKDGFVYKPSRETKGFRGRKNGWYLGRGTGWVLRSWVEVLGEVEEGGAGGGARVGQGVGRV